MPLRENFFLTFFITHKNQDLKKADIMSKNVFFLYKSGIGGSFDFKTNLILFKKH